MDFLAVVDEVLFSKYTAGTLTSPSLNKTIKIWRKVGEGILNKVPSANFP